MRSNKTKANKSSVVHCWLLAFIFVMFTDVACAAHPEAIVTPAWVNSKITARPATNKNKRYVILETGWGKLSEAKDYRAGHVPGAVYLNTDECENGYPRWHLKPVRELQTVIGRLGITPRTTVIVYSKQTIAAARIWWILNYARVADMRVLDGGYAAWRAARLRARLQTMHRTLLPSKPRRAFIGWQRLPTSARVLIREAFG